MEQANFSNSKNTETILAVSNKHWLASVLPAILTFLSIIWILSFDLLNAIMGIALLFYSGTWFLSNRNTSWVLTNDLLIIKSGFLPWKKIYYEIPKEDIYEAYFSQGVAGSLIGYATLVVRRNDGLSSFFTFTKMTNKEEIVGNINTLVGKLKKQQEHIVANTGEVVKELKKQNNQSFQNYSVADELYKLSTLREKGLITEEEFNSQKKKLIENQS